MHEIKNGLVSSKGDIRSYYEGLKQVLNKIKKEQIKEPIILHTDQGFLFILLYHLTFFLMILIFNNQ